MLRLEIDIEAKAAGVAIEIRTPKGSTNSDSELMAYLVFCDALNVLMRADFGAPESFDCTARSLRKYKTTLLDGGAMQ